MDTKLTLSRAKQFMEGTIPVNILVNGYLACQLKSGETKSISIQTDADIKIQAVLMNNKTDILLISEQDRTDNFYEISLVITNPVYYSGIVLAILSTLLVLTTNKMGYMALVAPPALYLLYYKFIRKDKYLVLRKLPKQETTDRPSLN